MTMIRLMRWFKTIGLVSGLLALGFLPSQAMAFSCSVKLVKTVCWKDRALILKVINADNLETETIHELEQDKSFLEVPLDCKKLNRVSFEVSFDPPIWEADKGRFYKAKRLWNIPKRLPLGADNWSIDLCFARDFSSVPLPLVDFTKCTCPNEHELLEQ